MKIIITIENDNCESVSVEVNDKRTEKENHIFDDEVVSPYARFFDSNNPYWQKVLPNNLWFLKAQEHLASDILAVRGYLFLNEVYGMLGMEQTKAGQLVGWVYDKENPIGDNYVDFNIYSEHNVNFVNGYDRVPLLDFNVDGNILDYLPEERS